MALSVGHLCSERGAEGVNIAEGHCKVLAVELAGNGEVGGLAEEVLAVIDSAVLLQGEVVEVKRGNAEHLACALAVGAGDYRRVNVHKASALEELVHSLSRDGADSERCGEEVRSGAEMLDRSEELNAVALLLQGVIGSGNALHEYFLCFQLKGLFGLGREHQRTAADEGRADVLSGYLIVIIKSAPLKYDLQRLKAAAVIKLDKTEVLHVAHSSYPAANGYFPIGKGSSIGKYAGNLLMLHNGTYPFFVLKSLTIMIRTHIFCGKPLCYYTNYGMILQ